MKSGLPKRSASEEGADKDDGFVSRRADMVTAGKDMGEKTAGQQKAAEIQIKGARMMSKANDLLQGSAASASASVQALAQQTAVTSQAGNMISSASASDIAQNAAAGGGRVVSPVVILVVNQGPSSLLSRWRTAVWPAARLTAHCCTG